MFVAEILAVHSHRTTHWHESDPVVVEDGFLGLVEQNHRENFCLWHEEDIARRDDLGAERIRLAKRAIDRCNQQRNNLVEAMDRSIVAALSPPEDGCPFNSETPGMMIDRLSILSLKEYHMAEEAVRQDASAEHRAKCGVKLQTIRTQIADLSLALAELFDQIRKGTRSFRVYYQFKMYNDAELNPQLRRAA